MPRYKTEVTHDLGQSEALARLKDFSKRASSFADLQGTWSENTFEFTVQARDAIRKRNELDLELWQYASQLLDDAIMAEGPGLKRDLDRYESSKLSL